MSMGGELYFTSLSHEETPVKNLPSIYFKGLHKYLMTKLLPIDAFTLKLEANIISSLTTCLPYSGKWHFFWLWLFRTRTFKSIIFVDSKHPLLSSFEVKVR